MHRPRRARKTGSSCALRLDIESKFGSRRAGRNHHRIRNQGSCLSDFIAKPEPTRGPAADLWRKTLTRIPTYFGRLVFLAALRDEPTGRYTHPPLVQIVGYEITDRTLRHSHHEIFSEWLGFSLAEQKADLDDYRSEER